MAKVTVTFHQAGNRSLEREPMPIARLPGARSELLTSGTAAVKSTLKAASSSNNSNVQDGGFVTILSDGQLWVDAGPNPTAKAPVAGTTSSGMPVPAGVMISFAVAAGDFVSVIDWS
jgi:hypothetical protein